MSSIVAHDYRYYLGIASKLEEAVDMLNQADSLRPGGFLPPKALGSRFLWALGRKAEANEVARTIRRSSSTDTRIAADADAIFVLFHAGLEDEVSAYEAVLFVDLAPRSFLRGMVKAAKGEG